MIKYKMVVSDFGETLVHTGDPIKSENVNAIVNYQESGGVFAIATGREWPSIRRKMHKNSMIELYDMPIICCYGSLIVFSKSEKVIFSKYLDIEFVFETVQYLIDNDIPYSLVTKDNTLVKKTIDLEEFVWKQYNNKISFDTDEQIVKYIKENDLNILKIDIYPDRQTDFFDIYLTESKFNEIKMYKSSIGLIEIVSKSAGKDEAFKFLVENYNFNEKEVVVVGDALNDIPLFKYSSNRVAVSNAIHDILLQSNYVIDNTDYLGIARLLIKILKGERI